MDVPLSSLMSNSAGLKTISYVDDVENISSLEALPAKDSSTARISIERRQRVRQLFNNLVCCFTRGEKNNGRKTVPKPTNHNHQASHHSTSKVSEKLLLPPVLPVNLNKKCLIVDLDETLVHSSFKAVRNPDFIIPVEIEGVVHQVYVLKRPHVDEFLQRIGKLYECILFTASLAKYADPVADLLDRNRIFQTRLFRESCVFHKGNYVKDLERLGRDLKRVVIIDNSPASYAFHPENAVAVRSWFDDMNDRELLDIVPYLEKLASVDDVYSILKNPSLARPVPRPLASPLNVNIVAQSGTSPVVNVINNININIISSVPKEYGIAPSSDQSYVKNHCSAVENCPTATTNVLAANNVSSIQSSDDAIVPNHHHHHHHHNHNHNHNHSSMPMTDNVLRQKNTLFNTSTSPPVKLTTSFVNDAGTPNNRLTVSTTTPQVDSVCDDTDKRSRHS